ncbi:MAG: hypothetical protein LBQ84_08945 [Flavobacteriaceae bacterium]|jgi:phosphate transport system substrate-binding protein|nr:hypothetical protein [Flavobacteriaceae bacterium]
MIRKIHRYVFILGFIGLLSCQKDIEKKEAYRKGDLTLVLDPSFMNLGTALVKVFQSSYPEAVLTLKPEMEDLVIADLVNGKIPVAMASRDLTDEEAKILFDRTGIMYIPSQIACDATIFIAAKESPIEEVSVAEVKSGILDANGSFVFDGGNSSNFNNVMRKLDMSMDKDRKITSLTHADKVIDFISKNKSHIGIIGLDVLSDEDDPKVKEMLTRVKILPVVDKNNKKITPTLPNLRGEKYPFTKKVYLLNAESNFQIGSSFARFCGSQRGQLIVSKAGLQPFYLYERRVEIH